MANFQFNITEASFKVERQPDVVTNCSTIFTWKVTSTPGNSVRFQIGQTYQYFSNAIYTQLGVDQAFNASPITVTYASDLYISFSLGNSGDPGRFDKCRLEVWDDTTVEAYNYFYDSVQRDNDGLPCDKPLGVSGTYDDLTDTPANKTGSALKLVRVNATEDGHEYVDAGTLGSDLNFSQAFTSTTSVVINHNLGKIPSVTVIDGSGNIVHGDIAYTDLNNLTITFNTAFAGNAYLN
tara:strand:+ start:779 stop:1489 length:711 start_codon:yes stop_codon:yes gene_type:complete